MRNTIHKQLNLQEQQLKALEAELENKTTRLRGLNQKLDALENNQSLAQQDSIFQKFMWLLGLLLALLSTLVIVSAFASALYSFGGHWIWTSHALTPDVQASFTQKAVFVVIKVILSFLFFMVSLGIMATPFGIYRAFLSSLRYEDTGFKGLLNKLFLR